MAPAMDRSRRIEALGGRKDGGSGSKRAHVTGGGVAGNPAATSRRPAPQGKPAGE